MAKGLKATVLADLGQASEDAGDNLDRAGEYTSNKIDAVRRLLGPAYVLSYDSGKAVQEVLNRYLSLLRAETDALKASGVLDAEDLDWQVREDNADIEYIAELAKLFD